MKTPDTAKADYYPYGSKHNTANDGSLNPRYNYQGQFADWEKGMSLNSFELRMYNPEIGRWISPDPYGQFISPYVGMGNNPVGSVDPDGGMILPYSAASSFSSFMTSVAIPAFSFTVGGISISFGKQPENIDLLNEVEVVLDRSTMYSPNVELAKQKVLDQKMFQAAVAGNLPLASGATEPFYLGNALISPIANNFNRQYGEVFYRTTEGGVQIPMEGSRPPKLKVGILEDPNSIMKFPSVPGTFYDKIQQLSEAVQSGKSLFDFFSKPDTIKFRGFPGGRTIGDTMYYNDGRKFIKYEESYY